MPTYKVPDIVEVELDQLELPTEVPVDAELNEKPLADCSKSELDEALRAFSGLVQHGQREIEETIRKHIEMRRRVAHLEAYRQNFDDIAWVREEGEEATP